MVQKIVDKVLTIIAISAIIGFSWTMFGPWYTLGLVVLFLTITRPKKRSE